MASAQLLKEIYQVPMYDVHSLNPSLYKTVPELRNVKVSCLNLEISLTAEFVF
jgi:hypothetical protein